MIRPTDRSSIVAAVVACSFSSGVFAATAFEHFDYEAGAELSGQGLAADGWAGAWTQTAGSASATTITSPGLTHAGVVSAGEKATFDTSSASSTVRRALAQTYGQDGTTTYISFIAQKLSGARFFGLTLVGPNLLIGQGSFNSNWEIRVGADGASSNVESTTQSLLVVRIDSVTGDDTATLWVDPDLSLAEGANASVQLTGIDFGTFSQVDLGASATSGFPDNDYVFDELTISDATPFVPEPATLGLLGVALPLLVHRRR